MGTDIVEGVGAKISAGVDKASAGLPVLFVGMDLLSVGRNSLALSDPSKMIGAMCPAQEAFGVIASSAGVMIGIGGLILVADGIKAFAKAETKEQKALALSKILLGLIFAIGGTIYASDWIATLSGHSAMAAQLGGIVPYAILACYGSSLLRSFQTLAIKLQFRTELSEAPSQPKEFKEWLLSLLRKDEGMDIADYKRERSEWLKFRTGFSYEEIESMDDAALEGLHEKILQANKREIAEVGLNIVANLIGGFGMDIAAFGGSHYQLSAMQSEEISAALFVAAALIFIPVDGNLVTGHEKLEAAKKTSRESRETLQETFDRLAKKYDPDTYLT